MGLKITLNAIWLTSLLIFAASPVFAEQERTPIKIGIVTDLSAGGAYWGKLSVMGAELAAKEITANGGKIQIVAEDAALKSTQAITASQKLLNVDHVDAVFIEATPMVVPSIPTLNNAKVPVIYVAAAESPLKLSKNTFKMFQDYRAGCREVAQKFLDRGLTPIGVLKAQAEYGEVCFEGIQEAVKDPIVVEYQRDAALDTEILNLKRKGAKSIINAGFEGDSFNTFSVMEKIQYHVPVAGGSEDMFTEKVRERFGPVLKGSLGFSLPEVSKSLSKEFAKEAKARNVDFSQPQAAGIAYVATKILYDAILECQKLGEPNIDCERERIKATPPHLEIGFDGFNDSRIGKFQIRFDKF